METPVDFLFCQVLSGQAHSLCQWQLSMRDGNWMEEFWNVAFLKKTVLVCSHVSDGVGRFCSLLRGVFAKIHNDMSTFRAQLNQGDPREVVSRPVPAYRVKGVDLQQSVVFLPVNTWLSGEQDGVWVTPRNAQGYSCFSALGAISWQCLGNPEVTEMEPRQPAYKSYAAFFEPSFFVFIFLHPTPVG